MCRHTLHRLSRGDVQTRWAGVLGQLPGFQLRNPKAWMTGLNANQIGLMAVLLFVSGGGIGLAWVGCGWWRQARTTRGGIPTMARIDRLAYTGPYLMGRFFASISDNDVKGSNQTAELAPTSVQWNRSREGQSL